MWMILKLNQAAAEGFHLEVQISEIFLRERTEPIHENKIGYTVYFTDFTDARPRRFHCDFKARKLNRTVHRRRLSIHAQITKT